MIGIVLRVPPRAQARGLLRHFLGEIPMRKQIIQYTSPIDALVAVTKRLSAYESRQQMDSEEFFDQYSRGQLSDDIVFVEWANDYRHYLELRQKLEKILPDVA